MCVSIMHILDTCTTHAYIEHTRPLSLTCHTQCMQTDCRVFTYDCHSSLPSFSLHRAQSAVQAQVIPPPQQPQQQQQHRVSTSLSLCMLWSRYILSSLITNHECYFPGIDGLVSRTSFYMCHDQSTNWHHFSQHSYICALHSLINESLNH